jgi:hypothetical protein
MKVYDRILLFKEKIKLCVDAKSLDEKDNRLENLSLFLKGYNSSEIHQEAEICFREILDEYLSDEVKKTITLGSDPVKLINVALDLGPKIFTANEILSKELFYILFIFNLCKNIF